ncbi:MAG: hypothetical protein WKF66_16630 [Pedobacter sp.]
MTPLKKVLLVTTGLLILVLVLRETELLDINYYKAEYKSSLNTRLNTETTTFTYDGQKPAPKSTLRPNDLSFIILLGKDTVYKEMNKLEPIIVRIDSLTSGPTWMPLYKSAKFSAVSSYQLPNGESKNSAFLLGYSKASLSGGLKIEGDIKIQGICSRKEAHKLIRNHVVESVTASTKRYFANSTPDFLEGIAVVNKIQAIQLSKD